MKSKNIFAQVKIYWWNEEDDIEKKFMQLDNSPLDRTGVTVYRFDALKQ